MRLRLSDCEEAIAYSRRALSLFDELGDERGKIKALSALADAFAPEDRHSAAIEAAESALELATRIGNPAGIAAARLTLGQAQLANGDPRAAAETLERATSEANALGQTSYMPALCHETLADACRKLDRCDESREHFSEAVGQRDWTSVRRQVGYSTSPFRVPSSPFPAPRVRTPLVLRRV